MHPLLRPIYTFVADDGENVHIDSAALYKWCTETKPEIFLLPLDKSLFASFIRDNVIAPQRVYDLAKRKDKDLAPIIMVKDGTVSARNGAPNVMLVDGHHRYALACIRQQEYIKGHMLELEQWKPFQLHGVPDMTQEQLIRTPILKRDY